MTRSEKPRHSADSPGAVDPRQGTDSPLDESSAHREHGPKRHPLMPLRGAFMGHTARRLTVLLTESCEAARCHVEPLPVITERPKQRPWQRRVQVSERP
jgi:hypothetical protein